ncbi:hypothetical protein ANCCAN_20737 [Ancylostoma caninum]|uniref:JmjC domain-containing protein n=1 Tax=Ancylostoma caninum TaxID=29170 RepID=A0A368FT71_ANCCA|nr:hypothetical protein ANCCAN_20737 [Ancylostoma caninum]
MLHKHYSISVEKIRLGSKLDTAVAAFLDEENFLINEANISFAATDKSGAVLGVCVSEVGPLFINLKFSVRTNRRNASLIMELLVYEAVRWARGSFPRFLVTAEVKEEDIGNYERLGFLKVTHLNSSCRLMFPPLYAQIQNLAVCGSSNDDNFTVGVLDLLKKIMALKLVPLVALRHLMDVSKLGKSIAYTFSRLALQVQKAQMGVLSEQVSQAVVNGESLLLDHAWGRLNTGHFSEVDQCWRRLYAAVSLVKAVRLACADQYLHAIAAVDLGLLMGDGIPEQLLQRYAQFCDRCLPLPSVVQENKVSLAVPKKLPNSVQIPVCDELSRWDFIDRYLTRSEPVIVRGLNSHWPAVKNWSFNYLHAVLCRRVVPVEQGSKYTDADWAQKLMTGSEFFNTCTLPADEKGPLYLAQHRLFNQVPQLCDDFSLPLYCDHCEFEDVDKNCWIGPGGTVSPLHTDPRENLFSQISGRKFFRMVSPDESDKVYAFKDGIITNTSQVDVLNPDLDKYPEFVKAKCWDGVVEGGDVLFIPKGWWHLVASLTNSISISFWFDK